MEGTLGEIRLFAGSFAPQNWAICNGQTLNIDDNRSLFNILGTLYGGDGTTSFNLPDFRARVAVGVGYGTGVPSVSTGQKGGKQHETLNLAQIPVHSHFVEVKNISGSSGQRIYEDAGTVTNPVNASCAVADGVLPYQRTQAGEQKMAPAAVTIGGAMELAPIGGNKAHMNIQPSLGLNYIICIAE